MKTIIGKVTSNAMQNTVTVITETLQEHPVYKKRMKKTTKYTAHTDKKIKLNSLVKIQEVKPISKRKCWKVIEVIEK